MCDMTHLYVRHDSFITETWLIYACDITHSCVWHDSFIRVTWLIHACDTTVSHWCVWHDSLLCLIFVQKNYGVCESMYVCGGDVSQCMYVVDSAIQWLYVCMYVHTFSLRVGVCYVSQRIYAASLYVCGAKVSRCAYVVVAIWGDLCMCHIHTFSLRGGLGYVSQCIYVRV